VGALCLRHRDPVEFTAVGADHGRHLRHVVPVIAQTGSFGSEVTAYNPNAGTISVNVAFYDANNTSSPGLKTCTALTLAAGQSVQFSVAGQCTLPGGSNFGLLILSEATGTQRFYGYARTQTPQGVGFSTEGFPIENFNDQLQHATGLKRVAASGSLPAFQTNCFVGTLGDAVDYELRLFNGTSGAQIGGTLSGSLTAYQQYRYLDVFAQAGAAAGDYTNVRAQFTNLTGAEKKLIGICTVQENTSFSADFRVAKSYGGTPQNAFVQGGNAFGVTALLGTTDNQPLTVLVNNQPTLRLNPVTDANDTSTVNVTNGSPLNSIDPGAVGATIAGGGASYFGTPSPNHVTQSYATIGGGIGNAASGYESTVAGGVGNTASGDASTVAGGGSNTASGFTSTVAGGGANTASGSNSFVAGGFGNTAAGASSFAAGSSAIAGGDGSFVWADDYPSVFDPTNGPGGWGGNRANTFSVRATGGVWFLTGVDSNGNPMVGAGVEVLPGTGAWATYSDRNGKEDIEAVNPLLVLDKLTALPIATWRWKGEDERYRHMGPMAQDFYAAFRLGADERHIVTVDAEGVALVAIQGLHQLLQEKDARIVALEQRVADVESLRGELAALKSALAELLHEKRVAARRD
jgi:hypothetical protein